MKNKIILLLGVVFISLLGCSSISVNYDYDSDNDFSHYSTYKWLQNKHIDSLEVMNSFDYSTVRSIADSILSKKGFVKKTSGKTDFFVIAYSGVYEKVNVSPWLHGYYPRWSYYENINSLDILKEGTLVIDFIDGKTKKLVWRGLGRKYLHDYYTTDEIKVSLIKLISKVLNNYPPAD